MGLNPRSVLARAEEIDDLFRVQLEMGLFCGDDADKRGKDVALLLVAAY